MLVCIPVLLTTSGKRVRLQITGHYSIPATFKLTIFLGGLGSETGNRQYNGDNYIVDREVAELIKEVDISYCDRRIVESGSHHYKTGNIGF